MLNFLSLAVKVQLNVHDLNNEAVAGNVTDIRMMDFLDEQGNRVEAPTVSGRMLKHWHLEAMRRFLSSGDLNSMKLCDGCKSGEPIRPGEIKNGMLKQVVKTEEEAVQNCSICDVHGYLIAKGAEGDQEQGVSSRRTSRAMFSWLMPVLGTQTTTKQVIHNRVSADPKTMIPFNKSYASGFYGFVSVLDVERIGLVESKLGEEKTYAVEDEERKFRVRAAIDAYRLLISGQLGASLSHAVPHANPIEVLVAYSTTGPLPFPVSPMYSDYIMKNKAIMPGYSELLFWGDTEIAGLTKQESVDSLFNKVIEMVDLE